MHEQAKCGGIGVERLLDDRKNFRQNDSGFLADLHHKIAFGESRGVIMLVLLAAFSGRVLGSVTWC